LRRKNQTAAVGKSTLSPIRNQQQYFFVCCSLSANLRCRQSATLFLCRKNQTAAVGKSTLSPIRNATKEIAKTTSRCRQIYVVANPQLIYSVVRFRFRCRQIYVVANPQPGSKLIPLDYSCRQIYVVANPQQRDE